MKEWTKALLAVWGFSLGISPYLSVVYEVSLPIALFSGVLTAILITIGLLWINRRDALAAE